MTPTNQLRAEASTTIDGVRHQFPVRKGSLGPDVIDITTLYAETGRFRAAVKVIDTHPAMGEKAVAYSVDD